MPSPGRQQLRNEPLRSNPASSSSGATVIYPLTPLQRKGLLTVISLASVSSVATFSLLIFLTYRFVFSRRYYRRHLECNQYVVLVYNLALADFQLSLGLTFGIRWVVTDSLRGSDACCFLQGVLLQIGSPMSGMFVLAIAIYTFFHVILGYQLGHRMFVTAIVCLWVFGVIIVIIPVASVGRYVWLPAVAWVSFHSFPDLIIVCMTEHFPTTQVVLVNN